MSLSWKRVKDFKYATLLDVLHFKIVVVILAELVMGFLDGFPDFRINGV